MKGHIPWITCILVLVVRPVDVLAEVGTRCPQRTKSHSTRCDKYFECKVSMGIVDWIVKQCDEGLIYEPSIGICVLPDVDWECNLPGDEVLLVSNDDENIYGINNLDNELFDIRLDEFPDNINTIESEAVFDMIKSNIKKVRGDYEQRFPELGRVAKADLDREEGSGAGEIIDDSIKAQLIQLQQLISGLQKGQHPETDIIPPDQLNSYLAVQKIQAEPIPTSTEGKVTISPDGTMSSAEITDILNMTDAISTTPSNTLLSDLTLPIEVSGPSPSVTLPITARITTEKENVSEELLRLMIELSKQIAINSQRTGDRPIYITVPVQTPGHQPGHTYQINTNTDAQHILQQQQQQAFTTTTTTTTKPTTQAPEKETPVTSRPGLKVEFGDRPFHTGIKVETFPTHGNDDSYMSSSEPVPTYTPPARRKPEKQPPPPYVYRPNQFQYMYEKYPTYQKKPAEWYPEQPQTPTYENEFEQSDPIISTYDPFRQMPNQLVLNYSQPPVDNYGWPLGIYPYPSPYKYFPAQSINYYQAYNNPREPSIPEMTERSDIKKQQEMHDDDTHANEQLMPDSRYSEENLGQDVQQQPESDYEESREYDYGQALVGTKKYVDIGGTVFPYDQYMATIYPFVKGTQAAEAAQYVTCVAGSRQANRTDCTRYFVCNPDTGGIHPYSCPLGTAFDAANKFCTKPRYRECHKSIQNNEGFSLQPSVLNRRPTAKPNLWNRLGLPTRAKPTPKVSANRMDLNSLSAMLNRVASRPTAQTPAPAPPRIPLHVLTKLAQSLQNDNRRVPVVSSKPKRTYTCLKPGKVPDPDSANHYLVCFTTPDNFLKMHKMKCPSNFEFCRKESVCTDPRLCT